MAAVERAPARAPRRPRATTTHTAMADLPCCVLHGTTKHAQHASHQTADPRYNFSRSGSISSPSSSPTTA